MKKFLFNNPRSIVLLLTLSVVVILNGSMLINPTWFQDGVALRISVILGFFSSVIFTWIFSEISHEKTFEEKQKLPAIRSYRQTKTIGDNVRYIIHDIEDKILQNNIRNTEHLSQLNEYKNLLYLILVHVHNIKLDWGDIVKDISKLNELEQVNTEISNLSKIPKAGQNEIQLEKLRKQKIKLEAELAELNTNLLISGEFSSLSSEGKSYNVIGKQEELPLYIVTIDVNGDEFEIFDLQEQINKGVSDVPLRINILYSTHINPENVIMVISCSGDLNQNDEFITDNMKEHIIGIKSINILNKLVYPDSSYTGFKEV